MAKSTKQRESLDIEAPEDQWGNKHEDRERYPEGSAAREGKTTPPSGKGGSSPHDGTSYQDQFPPNPEPSDEAKAWGEKVDEVGAVKAHGDAITEASGGKVKQSGPDKTGTDKTGTRGT
jgi:hypothetical protein